MPPPPSGTSQDPTPPETLGPPQPSSHGRGAQGHGSAWLATVPSRSPTSEVPHPAALEGFVDEEQSQLPLLAPVSDQALPQQIPVKTNFSSTFPTGHSITAQGDSPQLLPPAATKHEQPTKQKDTQPTRPACSGCFFLSDGEGQQRGRAAVLLSPCRAGQRRHDTHELLWVFGESWVAAGGLTAGWGLSTSSLSLSHLQSPVSADLAGNRPGHKQPKHPRASAAHVSAQPTHPARPGQQLGSRSRVFKSIKSLHQRNRGRQHDGLCRTPTRILTHTPALLMAIQIRGLLGAHGHVNSIFSSCGQELRGSGKFHCALRGISITWLTHLAQPETSQQDRSPQGFHPWL